MISNRCFLLALLFVPTFVFGQETGVIKIRDASTKAIIPKTIDNTTIFFNMIPPKKTNNYIIDENVKSGIYKAIINTAIKSPMTISIAGCTRVMQKDT